MSSATAIGRKTRSKPLQYLIKHGYIPKDCWGLDYGCGRGFDHESMGSKWYGYDPGQESFKKNPGRYYDIITCTYVLNVVDVWEQADIVNSIAECLAPGGHAFISVRRDLWRGDDVAPRSGRGCKQRYVELDLPTLVVNSQFEIYFGSRNRLQTEATRLLGA